MHITPFTALENSEISLDPLGFMQLGAELADQIFPQFTVLSRHPAYHGFFCFAFREARRMVGGRSGKNAFAREFRLIETFWGLGHLARENIGNSSVLNVRRYKALFAAGATRHDDRRLRVIMFNQMQYGVLGHYTRPSRHWRLIDASGNNLERLGEELADAWANRGRAAFADLLERWRNDRLNFDDQADCEALADYCVEANPSRKEREIWNRLIDLACANYPNAAPLWEMPAAPETFKLLSAGADGYQRFFPDICGHFARHEALIRRLDACRRFEFFAGLLRSVFDWEYLRRNAGFLDRQGYSDVESRLLGEIGGAAEHCREAMSRVLSRPPWALTWKMAQREITDYGQLAEIVIRHHAEHQRRKGASPFVDGDEQLVANRIDPAETRDFMDLLRNQPDSFAANVCGRHRRAWYFQQNAVWLSFAGRLPE